MPKSPAVPLDDAVWERSALTNGNDGHPVVFYQPIYSLRDSCVVSLEALVRWRRPDGQILGAVAALAKATTPTERFALDLTVLRQACADMTVLLSRHQDSGLHGLNVNLTPSSLVHPGLDVAVLDILEETGLPPVYLRLEVPETAAFGDLAEATDVLRRITATGVALTLDDVGVEAIGLRYLKTLAIDGIKIDRSFITRMLNGASDLAVVRLLVDLCAGLEIRLTAEGVERCEQLEVARSLGVRAIQGFHVARPMPFESIDQFLATGAAHVCSDCFGPGHRGYGAPVTPGVDTAASSSSATTARAQGRGGRRGQRAAVPSE